jgi:beta-N-acetylhexosaminidase
MNTDVDLHRLALGCLLGGWVGPDIPPSIAAALGDGLGGVVLFGSNLGDGNNVAELTGELRRLAARDVVIALDEEGGDVTRLDSARGSAFPGAAALGALNDPATTEQVYAGIGNRLAAAGVTVNLAPVADVNNNPANPVIGVRSFSADPSVAATHVAAAVRGVQRAGIAACVKHFPGHGDTSVDSHKGVATIGSDANRLAAVELPPFHAAIDAGTRSIMTAHLMVPALDPDELSTISREINTGLLREQLGFTGTIVTDALEMKAVADTIGITEGFVRALIAGADAIELGAQDHPDQLTAIPLAVAQAVRHGRLSVERLADAATRTAQLVTPGRTAPVDEAAIAAAASRCVTVRGPLPRLHDVLLIECRTPNGEATGELPWSLADPMRAAGAELSLITCWGRGELGSVVARIAGAAGTVVLVVRDAHRFDWQQQLLRAAAKHRESVVVDAGWPSAAGIVENVAVLETRGIAPVLLHAVAARLIEQSESEI